MREREAPKSLVCGVVRVQWFFVLLRPLCKGSSIPFYMSRDDMGPKCTANPGVQGRRDHRRSLVEANLGSCPPCLHVLLLHILLFPLYCYVKSCSMKL